MAQTLKYDSEIQQGATIQSWHVSQSVDAFTGTEAYDITLSGSFTTEGNVLHELNGTQTLSIQNFPPRSIVNTSDLKSEFTNAANLVMEKGQSGFPFNIRNKTIDIDGNFRNGGFVGVYNGTTSTNTANVFMHSDVDNALIKLNGEEDNGNKYFELNHDSNNTISYFTLNSTSTTLSNTRFRINADHTDSPLQTMYVVGDSYLKGNFKNDQGDRAYFRTNLDDINTSLIEASAITIELGDIERVGNGTTLTIDDSTETVDVEGNVKSSKSFITSNTAGMRSLDGNILEVGDIGDNDKTTLITGFGPGTSANSQISVGDGEIFIGGQSNTDVIKIEDIASGGDITIGKGTSFKLEQRVNTTLPIFTFQSTGDQIVNLKNNTVGGSELRFTPNTTLGHSRINVEGSGITPLDFQMGGDTKMRLDLNGNLGIGTTLPNNKLEVESSSPGSHSTALRVTNPNPNDNTSTGIRFQTDNNPSVNSYSEIRSIRTNQPLDGANILTFSTTTTRFAPSATERMRIDEIGNVGIGTGGSTLSSKLEVAGSSRFTGDVEVTGSLTISGSSTFTNIGPTVLNGSVGVNTSSPSTDFEVDGNIKSTNLEVETDAIIGKTLTTPIANIQLALNLKDIGDLNNINSPKIGDITQVSGVLYFYDGSKWYSLSMTAVE